MHALGYQHEQQRSDRNNFIEMLWNNIEGGRNEVNMRQEDTLDQTSFDVASILMYGLYVSIYRCSVITKSVPTITL